VSASAISLCLTSHATIILIILVPPHDSPQPPRFHQPRVGGPAAAEPAGMSLLELAADGTFAATAHEDEDLELL
jgi:hypothetical protein